MPSIVDIMWLLEQAGKIPGALGYQEPDPGLRGRIGRALGIGQEVPGYPEDYPESAAPPLIASHQRSDLPPESSMRMLLNGRDITNEERVLTGGFDLPAGTRRTGGGFSIAGDNMPVTPAGKRLLELAVDAASRAVGGVRGGSQAARDVAALLPGAAGLAEAESPLKQQDVESLVAARRAETAGAITPRAALAAYAQMRGRDNPLTGETQMTPEEFLGLAQKLSADEDVSSFEDTASMKRGVVEVPQAGTPVPRAYERMPMPARKELRAVDEQGHMIVSHDGGKTWYTSPGGRLVE